MQNRAEKQIMASETTVNCLFNDILCYLFIVCFDWKIGFFQQTTERVYYILNVLSKTKNVVKISFFYLMNAKCFIE